MTTFRNNGPQLQ